MGKEDKHPACLYVCVFEFVVRASKQVAAMTVMVTVVMVMMGVVEKEKEGERRGGGEGNGLARQTNCCWGKLRTSRVCTKRVVCNEQRCSQNRQNNKRKTGAIPQQLSG